MSEKQDLNRAKVSASFEKMESRSSAAGLCGWMFLCSRPARTAACRQAVHSTLVVTGRLTTCATGYRGNNHTVGLVPKSTPVGAERFKQCRAQHPSRSLRPLAAADVNHHPLAVDINHLQVRDLTRRCTRRV